MKVLTDSYISSNRPTISTGQNDGVVYSLLVQQYYVHPASAALQRRNAVHHVVNAAKAL